MAEVYDGNNEYQKRLLQAILNAFSNFPNVALNENAKKLAAEIYKLNRTPQFEYETVSNPSFQIASGQTLTIQHNLGYVPIWNLVVPTTGNVNVSVSRITTTEIDISNWNGGGNGADIILKLY